MNKKLPSEYKPFQNVWVCNNDFNNGHILVEVDSNPVFLIGKGQGSDDIFFWLKVPNYEGGKKVWLDAIVKNKVEDSRYHLMHSEFGHEVTFNGVPLIQFRVIDNRLIIGMINLQAVGLNIYGGLSSLNISGNNLVKNTFNHVYTMIGIGG